MSVIFSFAPGSTNPFVTSPHGSAAHAAALEQADKHTADFEEFAHTAATLGIGQNSIAAIFSPATHALVAADRHAMVRSSEQAQADNAEIQAALWDRWRMDDGTFLPSYHDEGCPRCGFRLCGPENQLCELIRLELSTGRPIPKVPPRRPPAR